MPATLTYPGVYIEEIPSGVRTITGVSTSTTPFVGRTRLGPLDTPVEVNSCGDFARSCGGIWDLSPLSFSVQQYFQNGGQKAVIVRVANGAAATRFAIPGAAGDLLLDASSPGLWGDNLQISIDTNTTDPANLFNITVNDPGPPTGTGTGDSEVLRNVSADPASPRFLTPILAQQSRFVRVAAAAGAVNEPNPAAGTPITATSPGSVGGDDVGPIGDANINDPNGTADKLGMYALEDQDNFNILVLPPLAFDTDVDVGTYAAAAAYCRDRRAFLIVDPPAGAIAPPATPTNSGFDDLVAALPPTSLDAQYS